jgi:hypothetical protein
MARGAYTRRPTQDHPAVIIPESIYARIVIAAEEAGISPGRMVEEMLKEGLLRHGQKMEDAEFYAACREAEEKRDPRVHRWEFDRDRKKRITDPK